MKLVDKIVEGFRQGHFESSDASLWLFRKHEENISGLCVNGHLWWILFKSIDHNFSRCLFWLSVCVVGIIYAATLVCLQRRCEVLYGCPRKLASPVNL